MTALIVRAGALVCAVLLIAGCGGDDELTDEQYFEQLQGIGDGIDAASESLFAAVAPLLATPREATALAAFAVASFAETRDRFEELAAAAHKAQSADELQPLLEAAPVSHQSSDACVALTELAVERELWIDLGCAAEGDGAAAPSGPPPT